MKAKVFATGRLGKDAEVKGFENGNSVIEFSLATNIVWKDKEGEQQQKTDWHDVRIYVKAISEKFVEKLSKGTSITVTGEVGYNEYEDKNRSKQKRMYMDVQPSDVTICGL